MSWWVYLVGNLETEQCVNVPHHSEGGSHVVGGCEEAELNITYNYSPHYRKHLDKDKGLQWCHKKVAASTIGRLEQAVGALGTQKDEDYWQPSPGNAGFALSIMLEWAKLHPEAVWLVR